LPEPIDPNDDKRIAQKRAEGWKPLWSWSGDGQKSNLVFVQTGANDGTRTEILKMDPEGGIKEGTEIIIEGPPSPESKGGLFDTPTKIRL
jgi:hypothetical protein